ncbi:HSP20-like chaperone [Cladochytrium replicatum]|nr:HSP20-like chaperone [Cladochytrium replicatum]
MWDPFSVFDRDPFFRDFDDYVRNRINSVFADQTQGPIIHNVNANGDPVTDTNIQAVQKHSQRTTSISKWMRKPHVDVSENEHKYLVRADLPGVKKEDVQIHLKDDILTIEGERKEERSGEQDGGKVHFYERSFGKFSRQMRLPADVDVEKTSASMTDGVLELKLGKKPEAKHSVRQISIQRNVV